MSQEPHKSEDLEALVLAFFDEELSAEQQRQLAERLRDDSAARALFRSYMRLEGVAADLGRAGALSAPWDSASWGTVGADSQPPRPAPAPHGHPSRTRYWIALSASMAGLVILGTGLWWWQRQPPAWAVPAPLALAHVARTVDANWIGQIVPAGGEIPAGTVAINSGLVELQFDRGPTVILEGPARLEITSAQRTVLHQGKVRTTVAPEAPGFVIQASNLEIVDLGTELGLEIDPTGSTEIHVFGGEAEIRPVSSPTRGPSMLLTAGQALRVDAAGLPSEIPADTDAFVDSVTLDSRAVAYAEDLNERLQTVSREQRRLVSEIRKAEEAVGKSPSLERLRQAANQARARWQQETQANRPLQQALADAKQAQAALESLYRQRMEQQPDGQGLLQRMDQATQTLDRLKRELSAARGKRTAADTPRRLHQEVRRAEKERNELRGQLRDHRAKLRRGDQDIREAAERVARARREVDRIRDERQLAALRDDASQARNALLNRQRKLLTDDRDWQRVRKELRRRQQEARELKTLIQQAAAGLPDEETSPAL